MKNSNLMKAVLATATLTLLTTAAVADRRTKQTYSAKLGEVGTHANDVEDFVPVSPAQRYQSITLVARGGAVPLDGLKIQFSDGRIVQPMNRGLTLRPGQRVTIGVPENSPIKMLVLDYDERRSSQMGDRATARVEVIGTAAAPLRYPDRYRDARGVRMWNEVAGLLAETCAGVNSEPVPG